MAPSLRIAVLTETAEGERRVALDPAAVAQLVRAGRSVAVESGAGTAATFVDDAYVAAGATVGSRAAVLRDCDVVAVVRSPDEELAAALTEGQTLIGLLDPLNHPELIKTLTQRGVTTVAFELLPRTLSRAQSMDALSSQSSAAGYRAAIVAAHAFGRYLPMMITASGTATPAKVIVIGAGVAGLQAIATTRRLGAVVTGYDIRDASRQEVESLGAKFLTSSVAKGGGAGGYARVLTDAEKATQQRELDTALAGFDVIVTTAKVPGHAPPELVSAATLATLRPGSVCVDLGSSVLGGNVAGSVEGRTTVTGNGVIVVGGGELAADLPVSASQMYGRNVVAVLDSLAPQGVIVVDASDAVHQGIVVGHDGEVTNAAMRSVLRLDPLPAALPAGLAASSASAADRPMEKIA
ncbi:NAD(P)(+) transhydrogenase (Re/Si-specific) subunit alpha [Amnibacterium sp.]|uniref:NAD(P)(+) transhydrogenase (Re/Si-specific) subunit alpha n=1 Tax=Amnibacterium sp. TaxID=1872496 RepID=UPI00260C8F9B|nr:NAD(P)(+) transhydrogenase (Re/Si-specific) subunit alpha [Amnibacterium sp.]